MTLTIENGAVFLLRLYKTFLENGFIKVIIGALVYFLALPITMLVLALMLIDYVTGLYKGYLTHNISSAIGRQGIGKIAIYLTALISASFVAQTHPYLNFINTFTAAAIAITELTSILENLIIICHKLNISAPVLDVVAVLLRMDKNGLFAAAAKGKLPISVQINISKEDLNRNDG